MRATAFALALAIALSCLFASAPADAGGPDKANRQLGAKDFEGALKTFGKNLKYADKVGDAQERAIAMYGLARASAYLCRVDDADKWFRDSIALRETLPETPDGPWLTQNYLEYARFLKTRGRSEQAAEYFGKSIPLLERIGMEQMDPIGYADVLDDYAATLRSIGKEKELEPHAARAAELRRKNSGRKAGFVPVPYPADCDARP